MKVIICGSRDVKDYLIVEQAIKDSKYNITEIVCSDLSGIDKLAVKWANKKGIPVKIFPANVEKDGKRAFSVCLRQMLKYAESVIVVWDGTSHDIDEVIDKSKKNNLHGFVYNLKCYYDKEATEEEARKQEQTRILRHDETVK